MHINVQYNVLILLNSYFYIQIHQVKTSLTFCKIVFVQFFFNFSAQKFQDKPIIIKNNFILCKRLVSDNVTGVYDQLKHVYNLL